MVPVDHGAAKWLITVDLLISKAYTKPVNVQVLEGPRGEGTDNIQKTKCR